MFQRIVQQFGRRDVIQANDVRAQFPNVREICEQLPPLGQVPPCPVGGTGAVRQPFVIKAVVSGAEEFPRRLHPANRAVTALRGRRAGGEWGGDSRFRLEYR